MVKFQGWSKIHENQKPQKFPNPPYRASYVLTGLNPENTPAWERQIRNFQNVGAGTNAIL